jgi:hypothetical protein
MTNLGERVRPVLINHAVTAGRRVALPKFEQDCTIGSFDAGSTNDTVSGTSQKRLAALFH